MAVNELLRDQGKSAGVIVLREIHPGYDIPLGVWNIRENVRAALRQPPITSDTLEGLWPKVDSYMDVKKETWMRNSTVIKEWKIQKRLDDFY